MPVQENKQINPPVGDSSKSFWGWSVSWYSNLMMKLTDAS